jgi:hypothetical protein
MAGLRRRAWPEEDDYVRERFSLPREQASERARGFLHLWPTEAYMSGVETWRQLPNDRIEFTMRRLRSAISLDWRLALRG